VLDTGLGLLRLAASRQLSVAYPDFVLLLGNEGQTIALREKRSGPLKIADCFIRAICCRLNESDAHIQDMISRLTDADVEEGERRITLEQDRGRSNLAV
jgi:hypothetical protein